MKNILPLILVLFIMTGFLSGCKDVSTGGKTIEYHEPGKSVPVEEISSSVCDDVFDGKFLSYISSHTEGNYMVSPLSFRYALGLLAAGAQGECLNELLSAFGMETLDDWTEYCLVFNGFIEAFQKELEQEIEETKSYIERGYLPKNTDIPYRALRVANSVWKNEIINADFSDKYKEYINVNYGAEYCSFNSDNAVSLVNEWVSSKTEKMIERLLSDNYDTTDLAIILMNALYYKNSWVNSFDEDKSKEDDFTTRSGETVKKTFMTQEEDYRYYEDDDTQLVIIPMEGDVYMTFVLGSTEGLSEKISKAETKHVSVTIPRMDIETTFSNSELVDFLKENGVETMFDPDKADFSAMIDENIFVSDIIQKTRIKLDEEGVEAAAVTAIMMEKNAMIEPAKITYSFVADRPFSFYIYTTVNNITAMMFAGEMTE